MQLGLFLRNSAPAAASVSPPTDLTLSASSVAEDAALGTVIGVFGGAEEYELTGDANGLFAVSGSSLIVAGVLDFETATSHNITARGSNAGGSFDKAFAITVTDVSETNNSGIDLGGTGDGVPVDDGSFTNPPVATEVQGGIKLHGKKAAGSTGKFIFDIGPISPSTKYTLQYDPDFSLLAQQGKLAMVGFGFRQGNNFRLSGLKGDGGSGLKAYEVHGTNWPGTSHSEIDGGAAAHGTQAGPNWLQIETNADNTTYTLRSSSDGSSWTDEFTGITPTPFSDLDTAPTFGIACYFDGADAGNFSVKITLWTIAAVALWTPAALGDDLDGWWDFSDTATITEGDPNTIASIADKSSNGNNIAHPAARPGTGTTTQNGLNVATFDGSQALFKASATGLSDNATGRTLIIVVKQTQATAAIHNEFVAGTSDFELHETGGNFGCRGRSGGDLATIAGNDTFSLISCTAVKTLRQIFLNGTAGTPSSTTDADIGTPDLIQVGFAAGGSFIMAGTIGEIIRVRGTDTTKRQLAEGYAKHKWATAALVSGHPYENAAPTV